MGGPGREDIRIDGKRHPLGRGESMTKKPRKNNRGEKLKKETMACQR